MVSARLEGGKKRGTGGGGGGRGMECRRVKAEHKVSKGQPREGGGSQSTLSEYKRGIVEI